MSISRQKDITYIEKWEGYFLYPVEDENYDIPKRVNFQITVEIKNNTFVGTHSDEESKPLFDEDGTIKGYFEDNFISFTLEYPYFYFIDDSGNLKTDRNKKHPEIHYYGNFKQETNSYIGSWEMFQEYNDFYEGKIIERIEAMWELIIVSSKDNK